MPDSDPPREGPSSDGDLVESVMADCMDRPRHEWSVALDDACRAHPEYATELRRRFSLVDAMGMAGSSLDQLPERLGEFRLVEKLGAGGMGVVYRAVQETLGREVALKILRPETLYFDGARDRFQRETEAVARLKHPGIVPIYTVGEDQGVPYFAMERIDGCTLSDVLEDLEERDPESLTGADFARAVAARSGVEPAVDAPAFHGTWSDVCLKLVRQVAEALHHAHEQGVLHRDIKPSNIAITPDGRALLLDFGLASLSGVDNLTRTGSVMGSLLYMSPEQVDPQDRRPDERTDVYSLGVTLYQLLTLQHPFTSNTVAVAQRMILDGNPRPIRIRHRFVPPEAEIVCLKAMDRDPQQRYPDAGLFAADLDNVQHHRPIMARRQGPVRRLQRWAQRHPALSVAAGLGFLLVTVTPSLLLWQQIQHSAALALEVDQADAARTRAEEEKTKAKEAADVSDAVVRYLTGIFGASDPHEAPGESLSAREVLDRGVDRIDVELRDLPKVRAAVLAKLGEVYSSLGAFDVAVRLLEESLEIVRDEYGEEQHPEKVARALMTLATACQGVADHPRAEALFREALVLYERIDEPLGVAVAHNNLGRLYYSQWRLDDALAEMELSVEIQRASEEQNEEYLAVSLGNLGDLLANTGDCERGTELTREALEIVERIHGPVHPELANRLSQYGILLKRIDRLEEAESYQRRALEMSERIYEDGHPVLVGVMFNMAALLQAKGEHEKAGEMYQKVLDAMRERAPIDVNRLTVESGYAQNRLDVNDWKGAEEMVVSMLPFAKQVWGKESIQVGTLYCRLGRAQKKLDQSAAAKVSLVEAKRILSRWAPDDPIIAELQGLIDELNID